MSEIDETKDLLRKLEPVFGSRTKALWYLSLLSKDAKSVEKNKELLRLLADKKVDLDYKEEIRLPPPSSEKLAGAYHLGNAVYPEKKYAQFGLREHEFIKHILIAGMTGTGKTNLMFQILSEFVRHKKPFLIFDWKKNYRALRKLSGFEDVKIIEIGSKNCKFRFNPLIPPPGVDPKHWMAMLVDVIKHAYFVAHGLEYFFRKGIDYLYEQFGIYEGKQDYPTFVDLEKTLQREYVKGRETLWMSSAKRVLASVTLSGVLGETLNVRRQDDIAGLLNHKVVFELDNLPAIERVFFVESLLLWIYHYRRNETDRAWFKHAIVIEEAHHILSAKKESTLGEETIMESIVRMIREFGESVIVIDQEPSKLSSSVLANTNCKICFNLGDGKDVDRIAKSMNLKEEEKRCIDKLGVGHAIIKMKARFSEPVHVVFPLVSVDKDSIQQLLHELDVNKLDVEMLVGG